MDAETAAQRWADTWSRAWPQRGAEAIAALYGDTVVYRSPAFRPPDLGLAGVRRYLNEQPLRGRLASHDMAPTVKRMRLREGRGSAGISEQLGVRPVCGTE